MMVYMDYDGGIKPQRHGKKEGCGRNLEINVVPLALRIRNNGLWSGQILLGAVYGLDHLGA